MSVLGGCGMSSLTSGIGSGWFGGQNTTKADVGSVSEDQLLQAAKSEGGNAPEGRFPRLWSRDGF